MSSPSSRRGAILRYSADRASVLFVLSTLAIRVALLFLATPRGAALAVVPLFLLSTSVAPLNHHHQHLGVFHSRALNRIYDLVLALQTGIGPYTWVLHHNLGHHQNYLNQPPQESPDESHWTRPDGKTMGRVEYTLHLFLHHQADVMRIGRKHPKIFRSFVLMKVPLYGLLGLAAWVNPIGCFLVFLLPSFITLIHTCWVTYEHHADNHATDHISASVNREHKLFNVLSWNLGYHTAHHMRPGLHWSLLPELHDEIRERIPEKQLLSTFW